MLGLVYFILFLALCGALTWWRSQRYLREHRLVPQRLNHGHRHHSGARPESR